MLKTSLLLAASFAGVQLMSAKVEGGKAPADYTKQIETWRAQRVERLKSPNGWLSLIGLHWLKDGRNTVGSAKDNDVVLAKGPAHLGAVVLKDGKATIELDAKADATIDGGKSKSAVLLDDSHEKPTTVAFGTASFYLIDRNGKKGLRVKDTDAQTRKDFVGIDNYPIAPSLAHRGEMGGVPAAARRSTCRPCSARSTRCRCPARRCSSATARSTNCCRYSRSRTPRSCSSSSPTAPAARRPTARAASSTPTCPQDGKVVHRLQQGLQPAVRVHAARDVPAGAAGRTVST